MLELPFLYIYPAIFPQQTLKTEEMVKSATLISLSRVTNKPPELLLSRLS